MPDPKDCEAFLNLCEMAIDNMYELEAIGELLKQKGVMTKDEIITLAKELKRKTPPLVPGPESYSLFTNLSTKLGQDQV
jgi:hypothetical protein